MMRMMISNEDNRNAIHDMDEGAPSAESVAIDGIKETL